MTLTGSKAILGLQSKFKPTNTNVINEIQIGKTSEVVQYPYADTIYSLQAFFANTGATFTLDQLTGIASGASTWTAGVAQKIKTTAVGTITSNTFLTIYIVGSSIPSISKNVSVNIGDTPSQWAAKVRNALRLDTNIISFFEISGGNDEIIITMKPMKTIVGSNVVVNYFRPNDGALNIQIDARTTGATDMPNSTSLVSGIQTQGCLILDGEGKDIEGNEIIELASIESVLVKVIGGGVELSNGSDFALTINENGHFLQNQFSATDPIDFTANSPTSIQVTILGRSIGLESEISVEVDGVEIQKFGTIAFGESDIGENKSVTAIIKNTGNGPLFLLSSPLINLDGDPDFLISTYPSQTIESGQQSSFTIAFNATDTGGRYSTLSIPNNDDDENPYLIYLTGTGT